jgi:hypothetical protein
MWDWGQSLQKKALEVDIDLLPI